MYTAESTGESIERTKMPNFRNDSKGGFEPGLTWLRVRHSTTELPRSTMLLFFSPFPDVEVRMCRLLNSIEIRRLKAFMSVLELFMNNTDLFVLPLTPFCRGEASQLSLRCTAAFVIFSIAHYRPFLSTFLLPFPFLPWFFWWRTYSREDDCYWYLIGVKWSINYLLVFFVIYIILCPRPFCLHYCRGITWIWITGQTGTFQLHISIKTLLLHGHVMVAWSQE